MILSRTHFVFFNNKNTIKLLSVFGGPESQLFEKFWTRQILPHPRGPSEANKEKRDNSISKKGDDG